MDVTDAYLANVIAEEEVTLDTEETQDLTTWIRELAQERIRELIDQVILDESAASLTAETVMLTADEVEDIWSELCVHSFMAGRAYQTQYDPVVTIPMQMSAPMVNAFVQFLTERSEA